MPAASRPYYLLRLSSTRIWSDSVSQCWPCSMMAFRNPVTRNLLLSVRGPSSLSEVSLTEMSILVAWNLCKTWPFENKASKKISIPISSKTLDDLRKQVLILASTLQKTWELLQLRQAECVSVPKKCLSNSWWAEDEKEKPCLWSVQREKNHEALGCMKDVHWSSQSSCRLRFKYFRSDGLEDFGRSRILHEQLQLHSM